MYCDLDNSVVLNFQPKFVTMRLLRLRAGKMTTKLTQYQMLQESLFCCGDINTTGRFVEVSEELLVNVQKIPWFRHGIILIVHAAVHTLIDIHT